MSAGKPVGAEASVGKIHWSETDLAVQSRGARAARRGCMDLGPDGAPGAWLDGFLFSLAGTIYAGTNEIQRNVVAERLLGMPRG